MNKFLLSKQNLESYEQKDLLTLAKYFGIDSSVDPQDLLWLLAIAIHSKQRAQFPPSDPLYLTSLDDDTLLSILTTMDWQDIRNFCHTSKDFNNRICRNEVFWQRLLENRLPEGAGAGTGTWSDKAKDMKSTLEEIQKWLKTLGINKTLREIEPMSLTIIAPEFDPSADDNKAIRLASREGHAEVVKLLIADPRVEAKAADSVMKIIRNQTAKRWVIAGTNFVVKSFKDKTITGKLRGKKMINLSTAERKLWQAQGWKVLPEPEKEEDSE